PCSITAIGARRDLRWAVGQFGLSFRSVGSFSSCPVLVAHHLSASGFDPHGRFGSGGRAGAVSDQIAAGPISSIFLVRFFVRSEGRFFVPTCPWPVTPGADSVKEGRRGLPSPSSALARPRLDGGEPGVTLGVVGTCTISCPCA